MNLFTKLILIAGLTRSSQYDDFSEIPMVESEEVREGKKSIIMNITKY